MRMITTGRKLIACWPKTDTEGGIESTSRGDARKDWQRTVGGKVGVEKISGTLRTGWQSLSETSRAPEATFWAVKRGTKEVGHKRGNKAEEKGG
jgi:hypothetical protein